MWLYPKCQGVANNSLICFVSSSGYLIESTQLNVRKSSHPASQIKFPTTKAGFFCLAGVVRTFPRTAPSEARRRVLRGNSSNPTRGANQVRSSCDLSSSELRQKIAYLAIFWYNRIMTIEEEIREI